MIQASRPTLTSIVTLVVTACSMPAPEGGASSAAPDSIIAAIDARVAEIERSLPRYRVLDRDLLGLSAEDGQLIAYGPEGVIGGGVRKVVATHFGETKKGRADLLLCRESGGVADLCR
jgi:hypothetical protein